MKHFPLPNALFGTFNFKEQHANLIDKIAWNISTSAECILASPKENQKENLNQEVKANIEDE